MNMNAEITFEVDPELHAQVQALCDQNGTTIEIIVNQFLTACVNDKEWAIDFLKFESQREK